MRRIVMLALLVRALSAQTAPEIGKAVMRALPPLENSASAFVARRACVSCHHNILPVLMLHMAQARGLTVDSSVLAAVEDKTFRALRGPMAIDDAIQAATLNDPTPNDSFLLWAAHAAGSQNNLAMAVYARRIANWQRDGHWVTSDFRPPHSSSVFTATATAVYAVSRYMPGELTEERDECVMRARRWLVSARPASTEDASFRVMGLTWVGATADEIESARRDLEILQVPGGGWPELPGYPADAYSTGEALYALEARISDRAWRDGMRFLLSTQAADGTWHVRTRMISPAVVSPEYFTTGFPYEKDEYLSYAGSVWAAMAMIRALPTLNADLVTDVATAIPEARKGIARARDISAADPAWVRTALFGSARQLADLLDHGLNPNSKTDGGTTLLMMAAPDADKVRLLLSRGAEPNPKALAIATAYRGTSPSVKALLDAGIDAKTRKALQHASMSGDLENVRLLLSRGADPSAGLSDAVTFGYPGIVRALIAAGASAKGTESSGINLLHWAAIANRPEVVPALVEAGVSLNATDDFLYTPLMYAATIDFGDTRMLKALLKAGADKDIRNSQGRTALEQARYYHHTLAEAALR